MNQPNRLGNYLLLAENEENEEKRKHFLNKALQFARTREERAEIAVQLLPLVYAAGDFSAVRNYAEELLEAEYERCEAYYFLGLVEDDLGHYAEAERFYRKSIKEDPDFVLPHFALGFLHDRLGQEGLALHHYLSYIDGLEEYEAEDASVFNDVASIYLEHEDYDAARVYLEDSIALDENYFRSWYNLGVLEAKLGEERRALDYYDRAIELCPTFMNSYLNESAIYIARGDFESSVNILNRGLDLLPDSVDLLYNRACSYARLGMEEEARSDLEYADLLDPEVRHYAFKDKDFKKMNLKLLFDESHEDNGKE